MDDIFSSDIIILGNGIQSDERGGLDVRFLLQSLQRIIVHSRRKSI